MDVHSHTRKGTDNQECKGRNDDESYTEQIISTTRQPDSGKRNHRIGLSDNRRRRNHPWRQGISHHSCRQTVARFTDRHIPRRFRLPCILHLCFFSRTAYGTLPTDTRHRPLAELYGTTDRISSETLVGMVGQRPIPLADAGKKYISANAHQEAVTLRRSALPDSGNIQRMSTDTDQEK